MEQPVVSVLLPCFQSAAFVHRAIDSVLGQRFTAWELVAVDNASDDSTWAVLSDYARRDPRIRAYRNTENIGPVRNWRRAVELGRGRLGALLFSDDWYDAGFLEASVDALSDPAVGWVQSAVRVGRWNGESVNGPTGYVLPGRPRHDSSEYLRSVLEGRGPAMPYSPGCALMRRSDLLRWLALELPAADVNGYLRHGAGPDVLCYLQAAIEYPQFVHLKEPLVNFLKHGQNLSNESDVARAYVAALHWFIDAKADAGVDTPRARASLWWRARRTGAPRPQLGPTAWIHVVGYLLRGAGRRLVRPG